MNPMNSTSKLFSIWDIVVAQATTLNDKTFLNFIDDGQKITYRQAAERSELMGRGLLENGVSEGSKVGLLLKASALHVYAWFATLGSALVDVPINPDFRGALLDHAINKIEVTVVFADLEGLNALQTASPQVLAKVILVVVPDVVYDQASSNGIIIKGMGRIIKVSELEDAGRYSNRSTPVIDPRALASIRFSSGTTGMPKGVMMDHGHMLSSARKFNDMMNFGADDIMYTCFPFHHVFATITGVLSTMCAGGSMIVSSKFSASRYWQDIREHDVTRAHVLDPLVPLLMKQPLSELDRQHRVRVMYTAAGHYPEFEKRFDVRIIPLYDMSELTVALHYPDGDVRRIGSCGKESGLFDVKIFDEKDAEVPAGVDGEIVVRPRYPSIMFIGYYNDSEQTVTKWRNLWFHTGDRGRKDEDGYYYFLGRLGDRIRRRGVNVSAEQVESVALKNTSILACAAIAVPSDMGEDDIKLCVQFVAGSQALPGEISSWLASNLPKTMGVRYVEVYSDLPKTQTEKVQRAVLRQHGDRGLTPMTWDHDEGRFLKDQ